MGQMLIDGILVDSETGELINEVQEVEVVVEENQLPEIFFKGGTHIQVNLKQLEQSLTEHLKTFDIEVTAETEKDASKQATALNKIAKELNSARLAVAKEIKKPADDLKIAVDKLIGLVQEKRGEIIEGVEVFKSARFAVIKDLLEIELCNLYLAHRVDVEYQTADIEPLIKEGSMAKVELSKAGKEGVEALVIKAKTIQSNVKIRLLELPVKCKELKIPFEEKDVLNIIKLDDDEYEKAVDMMIVNRLDYEARLDQQQKDKELREIEKAEQKVIDDAKALEKQNEVKKQVEQETGKKIVRVTAVFDVEVDLSVSDLEVQAKYQKVLSKFPSLKSIELGE